MARLLCSAVDASAAAGASAPLKKQLHTELAHEHVRLARKLPDCAHDPEALEIEINLLLMENNYPEASALAQKIIAPDPKVFILDDRSEVERDLSIGRAHRYQALARISAGNPLLAVNCLSAALSKFRKHPHVREINLLNFAQIAELRAACAKRLLARQQLDRYTKLTEICYTKLLNASDPWRRGFWIWILSKTGGDKFHTYLRMAATAGLQRLERLRSDDDWLPPPFPTDYAKNNSLAPAPPA